MKIFFDEAGYTGNNLLDKDQPYFCYLGLISDHDLEIKFLKLKKKYHYNNDEVKGSGLLKSGKGKKFIKELFSLVHGRYFYVIHDKKYVVACKIFEYIYEPVFADVSTIFYFTGFHKYISSFFYDLLQEPSIDNDFFLEFQTFIRKQGNIKKTDLYQSNDKKTRELVPFYNFCMLYRDEIASDVEFMTSLDKWLLDLTLTSFSSLLQFFSISSFNDCEIICDSSKPLQEQDINGKDWAPFFQSQKCVKGKIKFADSKEEISLQIADILVSSLTYLWKENKNDLDFSQYLLGGVLADRSILPQNLDSEYTEEERSTLNKIYEELGKNTVKKEKIKNIQLLNKNLKWNNSLSEALFVMKNSIRSSGQRGKIEPSF